MHSYVGSHHSILPIMNAAGGSKRGISRGSKEDGELIKKRRN